MAKRELGPAALEVAQAVAAVLPAGEAVVGCSGGADSLALALGTKWVAARCDAEILCVVVDHGLQAGSDVVAADTVELLTGQGLRAEVRAVAVDESSGAGLEAAAREARLAALESYDVPVLLGHTLDDQAESVLLALLRGSGTRAISGMAAIRVPFIRPLLGVRRATTEQACAEWGVEPWQDPHNKEERFGRVRVRNHLASLNEALGRDVAPALARTAALARTDADFLDDLASRASDGLDVSGGLPVDDVAALPDALRLRVLRNWLAAGGVDEPSMVHLQAVDALVVDWSGQGPVDLPGATVRRVGKKLVCSAGQPARQSR